MRALLILILALFAGPAFAAELAATPATLPAVLALAKGGDVVQLAPGAYGDVRVAKVVAAPGVVRLVADPTAPAVFNSLLVRGAEGLRFEGVTVAFAPTMQTRESQNVVSVEGSKRITFTGGRITAGPAINGIDETATVADWSGNVKGWPWGRGFYTQLSQDIEISDSEVWSVQRGLLTYKSTGVRFLRNHVHDVRRTFILGDASDLTIAGNYLYGSRPWRWGQTPIGDHGDCIALYPSSLGPMARVAITGNVCEQRPGGTAILGFTLASIRGLEVRGNVLRGTDHQGIVATDVIDATVADNVLTGRAGILLRSGSERVAVSGNVAAWYEDRLKGSTGNSLASARVLTADVVLPGGGRLIQTAPRP